MSEVPEVRIYQAYYRPEQQAFLDPAFIPLDNLANPYPDLAEYYLFQQHVLQHRHVGPHYSAVLSWKFGQKTKLRGERVLRFIADAPGHAAYFFNPAPQHAQGFRSIWEHGERYHPGLTAYVQRIFDELGYQIRLSELRNSERDLLFCNYWVGNERFWTEFMAFAGPVHDWIVRNRSEAQGLAQAARHSSTAYRGWLTYYPFIMERLASTLAATRPDLQVLGFEYPEEYRLLVQDAHATQETFDTYVAKTHSDTVRLAMRLSRVPGVEPLAKAIVGLGRRMQRLVH